MEEKRDEIENVDIRTLYIMLPLDQGIIYASSVVSIPLEIIFEMIGKHRDIIFFAIVSRLIRQESDISLVRFLETSHYPEIKEIKKDRTFEALN